MEQEVVSTRILNPRDAAENLVKQLKKAHSAYQAVIFLADINYDFAELSKAIKEKFPQSEVIGTSTAGEIDRNGFGNNSVVLCTMSDARTKVRGVLVKNGSKYPMSSKVDIENALRGAGISCGDPSSHRSAFALAFINGVFNAEESILTTFYSIIKNDDFPLAGGTAGFTGNEPKTFVSYNGEVTQDGAAMLFVKTPCKFDIRQEDIFNPTGKRFLVNDADAANRKIARLNSMPAKTAYAQSLGVSELQAEEITFENPFARSLNGSLHIVALAGFSPQKEISLFARVVPNSVLELMHIGNPVEKCEQTCGGIKSAIQNPKFTLMMTCITRTLAFDRMRIKDVIIEKYKQTFPTFCGFSCYGEQIGRVHCNQTLVTLVIGD